jgi:hypothetical protein
MSQTFPVMEVVTKNGSIEKNVTTWKQELYGKLLNLPGR